MRTAAHAGAALVGGVMALGAAAVCVGAAVNEPPVWFLVLFEGTVLVAGVIALLTGLGFFRASPAMALVCAAGTVLGASVLGYESSRATFTAVEPRALLLGHAACAAALAACAAALVLQRGSMGALAAGTASTAAAGGVVAAAWVMRDTLRGLPQGVVYPLAILGFVVVMVLLSAGVHLVIKAFTPETR